MFKQFAIVMLRGFFPYFFKFKSHVNHKLKTTQTDIKHYKLEKFSPFVRKYLTLIRYDRPTGTLLVLIPALWSLAFYGKNEGFITNIYYFLLVCAGAFIARSLGCIVNDLIDIDIDRKVIRTKNRPLAAESIKVWQAICFALLLALIGFFILTRFNTLTVFVIGFSVIPIAVYPLMKRLIKLPQAFLALVFNWGILIGPFAYQTLDFKIILLYIAGMLITFAYDSTYAIQDIEDDKKININSSAIYFGKNIKKAVFLSYLLAMLFFTLFLFLKNMLNIGSVVILALALMHIIWQVLHINLKDHTNNLIIFNSNTFLLLLLYFTSLT